MYKISAININKCLAGKSYIQFKINNFFRFTSPHCILIYLVFLETAYNVLQ